MELMTSAKLAARAPLGVEPHRYAGKPIKSVTYCLKKTTTNKQIYNYKNNVLQVAASERTRQQSQLMLF